MKISTLSKSDRDNRANQLNPICVEYHLSRGLDPDKALEQAIAVRETLQQPSEPRQSRPRTRKPA